jgi:hypothetical protein
MHSHDLNNVLPEGRATKQLTGMVQLELLESLVDITLPVLLLDIVQSSKCILMI